MTHASRLPVPQATPADAALRVVTHTSRLAVPLASPEEAATYIGTDHDGQPRGNRTPQDWRA